MPILIGALVLGLMVLVHEWGHFLAAKLLRIRVDIFSVGFGPRLFGVRRGSTDYRFSAFPLGGYVRMAGDNPAEERSGSPNEFLSRPRWQRALVVLAGPVTNLLFAVVLLTGLFSYRYERPAYVEEPAVIGAVVAASPAAEAGLQAGDRIVALNELTEPRWQDVLVQTAVSAGHALRLTVARGSETLTVEVTPRSEGRGRGGFAGWLPYDPPVVTSVLENSPAARAGLQAGDVLLALNEELLTPTPEEVNVVSARIQKLAGAPLGLTVGRGGEERTVSLQAAFDEREKRWMLGIGLGPRTVRTKLGPLAAVKTAVAQLWTVSGRIADVLGRLITRRADLDMLQGPVGIVRLTGEAAAQGWLPVLNLMVFISLSLGWLNLLPIPILDGGHLFLLAVEGTLGRDLSLAVKEWASYVGLAILALIFGVVMYNDIRGLFGG